LYDYHSLGVRGLHSYLERAGHDVESVFFKSSAYTDGICTRRDVESLIARLKTLRPSYLGVGVRSPLFPLFKYISQRVHSEIANCKIVVGGAHPTADPASCLEYADYIVVGEGENALLGILNGDFDGGGIVNGEPVRDLDSLPFPYYGSHEHYLDQMPNPAKMTYNTTRGCFFGCNYCQESIGSKKRRRKSVGRVAEDLFKIKGLFPSAKIITFGDSVFAHDDAWLEEFGDELKGKGFTFWGNAHVSTISGDTLWLLRRAGFSNIRIGVQSGSDYIRREIFGRTDSLAKILEVAGDADRMGLRVDYDFIIENPYDTPETMKDTRDFIKKLPNSALINKFELRWWPGTPLTARALSDGVIDETDVAGSSIRVGQWSYVYQDGGM
jgi:radical SAM superfamily enzyme YgiQ (UPF0313 family)